MKITQSVLPGVADSGWVRNQPDVAPMPSNGWSSKLILGILHVSEEGEEYSRRKIMSQFMHRDLGGLNGGHYDFSPTCVVTRVVEGKNFGIQAPFNIFLQAGLNTNKRNPAPKSPWIPDLKCGCLNIVLVTEPRLSAALGRLR